MNNIFYSRKARKGKKHNGTLPRSAPNRHRVGKQEGTSRSSPTQDERLELTKKGRKRKEKMWTAIFSGREKINALFLRAGIELRL